MATAHASGSLDPAPRVSTSPNPNNLTLIPYVKLGDTWTLPDSVLVRFCLDMVGDGTFRRVFYERTVNSPEDFVATLQKPSNVPVFVFHGEQPIAVAWLNGMAGYLAFAHFCTLRTAWGSTEAIGREVLSYWRALCKTDGTPIFTLLMGVIPSSNRLACRLIERIGFRELGEIPALMTDHRGKVVGARISYLKLRG